MARTAKKAKAAPAEAETTETAAEAAAPAAEAAPALKLPELIERVVARSGAKKKDAKTIVGATLAVLGEALAKGESLNLPEFGKAKVNRQKDQDGVGTMVVKLRRTAPKAVKVEPAAVAD